MMQLRCRLTGQSPLLMHNPAGQLKVKSASVKRKEKHVPTPKKEAAASRYLLDGDVLAVPTSALRRMIIVAAGSFEAEKMKSLRPVLTGAIEVPPPDGFVPLTRDGAPIRDYAVDVRRVVVQRQGVLRARARVDLPWELEFDLWYNDEAILDFKDSLAQILQYAGTTVGLLDYRPEKGGWFGRFLAHVA